MNGKFNFLVEAVGILQKDVAEMKPFVALIPDMRTDIQDIKQVVQLHSREIYDHDVRISRLEKHVA